MKERNERRKEGKEGKGRTEGRRVGQEGSWSVQLAGQSGIRPLIPEAEKLDFPSTAHRAFLLLLA